MDNIFSQKDITKKIMNWEIYDSMTVAWLLFVKNFLEIQKNIWKSKHQSL